MTKLCWLQSSLLIWLSWRNAGGPRQNSDISTVSPLNAVCKSILTLSAFNVLELIVKKGPFSLQPPSHTGLFQTQGYRVMSNWKKIREPTFYLFDYTFSLKWVQLLDPKQLKKTSVFFEGKIARALQKNLILSRQRSLALLCFRFVVSYYDFQNGGFSVDFKEL